MTKLVRFVIKNSLIGIFLGCIISAALVWFNINGLGDLFAQSDSKILVAIILCSSFGTTFGFATLMTALMLLPADKNEFDKIK